MGELMDNTILLAHGSGGKLSHDLVINKLVRPLNNKLLAKLDDCAVFKLQDRLAFTTDSYVVNPIFFPGGDIGKLAICGTVNDLSMSGSTPLYLSLALIIEEGFLLSDLEKVVNSIKSAAEEAEIEIITGDTKVVNRGCADKIFISTSGIGLVPEDIDISGANAKTGDKIILSGTIGDHGIAILSQREGLKFSVPVLSDCAPLNHLVAQMLQVSHSVHVLRDPTRGGLATTLNEIAKQSHMGIKIEEDKIPVKEGVRAACELLGFDELFLANEGKLVAIVDPIDSDKILCQMKTNPYAIDAAVIGEVTAEHNGKVIMKTLYGTNRIVDMLTGDLLPRIC
jgi:hydrogenase expression/formation protein HypE